MKCWELWGDLERSGRHYSDQQTVQQSNVDRRRLDRERCHSQLVASLGESWDRDPGALSWRLRSLGASILARAFLLCLRDPAV